MYAKKRRCSGKLWEVVSWENYSSTVVEAFNDIFFLKNLNEFWNTSLIQKLLIFFFLEKLEENFFSLTTSKANCRVSLSCRDGTGCIYYMENDEILFQTKLR